MTILELKKNHFKKIKSLDFDLILVSCLKKSREFILANPNHKISSLQHKKLNKLIELRRKNYPIAYLTNHQEFYGLDFYVNRNVLIPRPETELMIESITNYQLRITNGFIIDVGTGSGCIITTLAKLGSNLAWNDKKEVGIKYIATDISPEALKIAKKNARLNGVEKLITFKQGNLLEPIMTSKLPATREHSSFSWLIACNLPYLTPQQIKNSPSIKHEPKLALTAGPDGLKYYRQLFKQLNKYKISNYTLFCEIDHTQTSNIKKLIKTALPKTKFEIKKDLGGYNRLVIITKKRQ